VFFFCKKIAKIHPQSALTLCLGAHLARCQYQTAPAYGNGYQQQRKMAPSPQNYRPSSRQEEQMGANENGMQMDSYGAGGFGSMMEAKSGGDSYGSAMNSQESGYGGKQQMGNGRSMGMSYGGGNGGASMQKQAYGGQQQQQQQQQQGYGNKGASASAYGQAPEGRAEPFAYGYDINDGYGNTQYHKENGDEQGKVTGSYGYRDAYGVFRYVDYVADEHGFRATVKTNEPGTANESPADVDWQAEEPPAQTNPGSKTSAAGYSSSSSSSSYGSSSSMNGASDSESAGQYGSGSSMGQGSMGASKYNAGAQSGTSGYGQTSGAAMGMQQVDASGQSYGAMGMPMGMMGGRNGASKYSNGAAAGSGSRGYGSEGAQTMMMGSQGRRNGQGRSYGAGNSNNNMQMMMMAPAGGYGGANGASGQAEAYGAMNGGSSMGSAGRSSRYKAAMGASKPDSRSTSGYGQANGNGAENGLGMGMMAAGDQYGGQTNGEQQMMVQPAGEQQSYGNSMSSLMDDAQSDAALAQQYGPSSSMNTDAASTYSSMRLQQAPSNGGSQRPSGYGNGNGNAMMQSMMSPASRGYSAGAMRPMGEMNAAYGGGATKSAATNGMDYKKAATRNIAALVKRY